MPEILKLAEFFEYHDESEVNVRGGGIYTELDAQRVLTGEAAY